MPAADQIPQQPPMAATNPATEASRPSSEQPVCAVPPCPFFSTGFKTDLFTASRRAHDHRSARRPRRQGRGTSLPSLHPTGETTSCDGVICAREFANMVLGCLLRYLRRTLLLRVLRVLLLSFLDCTALFLDLMRWGCEYTTCDLYHLAKCYTEFPSVDLSVCGVMCHLLTLECPDCMSTRRYAGHVAISVICEPAVRYNKITKSPETRKSSVCLPFTGSIQLSMSPSAWSATARASIHVTTLTLLPSDA